MTPDDLTLWRRLQQAGDPTPWPGLHFLADGEQPRLLDTSHLAQADLDNPDVVAHVAAVTETAGLITWAAEDQDEPKAFGYWRGPHEVSLADAPIVTFDSEWQFELIAGPTLTEALCAHVGDYADEGYGGLAEQCRALGVAVTVDDPDDFAEPVGSPDPRIHCQDLYYLRRGGL